jgi:hypothetical protein
MRIALPALVLLCFVLSATAQAVRANVDSRVIPRPAVSSGERVEVIGLSFLRLSDLRPTCAIPRSLAEEQTG